MNGNVSRRSLVARIVGRPTGAVVLAVALSVLSTPVAAISIQAVSPAPPWWPDSQRAIPLDEALRIAFPVVIVAGVVGGGLGGLIVRRQPVGGLFVAMASAWLAAIVATPVLAWVLGIAYNGAWWCFDGCEPALTTRVVWSGAVSYLESFALAIAGPLELAVAFAAYGRRFSGRGRRRLSAALAIATFLALNFWTFAAFANPLGNIPAVAALVIGAVIWVIPYWRQAHSDR